MEVLLKIIGVDGTPRTVVVKPGDTVKVQPGETVIVSPDQKAAVGVMQQGQDLVLRIDGGEVAVQGFFPSPAQAASEPAPSALVYQDEQGLHVSDGRGAEAVSSSFEVLPLAGVHLPEGFSLSEQFMLPGYEQRLEALRAVFPEVDGFDATLAGGPPELEPITPAALQVGLPEPLAPYKLTLDEAQEGGGSTLTGDDPLLTAVVASRSADPVLEPNQSPDFTPRSPLEIAEDAAEGTTLDIGAATDADGDALQYSLIGGNVDGAFAINADTGEITVADASVLDFEIRPSYTLTVAVDDGHGHVVERDIEVSLLDVNDAPLIANQALAVTENSANGTVVGTVQASDVDAGQTLTYSITGGSGASAFQIDAATGELSVADAAQLDREAVASLTVEVSVTDSVVTRTATVTVAVNGINDFAPQITSNANFNVVENGTTVGAVVATDADAGGPALVYSLVGGADQGLFAINASTGVLRFLAAPDFESPADSGADNVYNVDVQVSDGTNAALQSVTVTVADGNDAPLITSSASATAVENQTVVTTVTASDIDGDVPTFAIVGGADAARFTVDANSGALSFVAAPNFEAPTDSNGDNVYVVQVRANDGNGGLATQTLSVTVSGENDNTPVITSVAAVNFAENGTGTAVDVNATDADLPAQALSYSITGGADAAQFAINAATGVVTFIAAPDFEAPTDAGGDNVYDLQVTASDGTLSVAQNIAVTVTGVNDANPLFVSAGTANFAENAVGTILTVQASDADLPAQTLSYSISGGADAARFAINATTGALSFVSSPNAEAPTDAGANNVYDVQVTASDGTRTTNQSIAVTVTGVNDNAPVITSANNVVFTENGLGTVLDVNATDADVPADTLTFSISGGVDAAFFAIDSATGVLTFVTPPNFEAPADAGANNVYNVQVTASDGTSSVNQAIAVTIADVGPTVFISPASATFAEAGTGTVLDVDAASEEAITYSISGGADAALFAIDAATGVLTFVAPPDFEVPADAGANNVYDVQVTASTLSAGTVAQNIAITVTAVNDNDPVITSATTASFAENATGTVIDVNATDADLPAQTLTFSITGGADAAKFAINATTGVVTFVSSPNFESPTDVGADNVYDLTVTASDGTRTVNQAIAVTVTAVNEFSPVFTSAATANFAENGTGTIVTVQATDADLPTATLTYSISGGVDAAKFAIDSATGALTFVSAPNFEAPTDSGANNVYNVQVTASDGTRSTNQALAITVTAVNDNDPVITSAATVNFAENATGTVIDVNATDADLPAQTLTFSITGGADAARFAINATTGVVTFVSSPNFESPTDVGADNVYDLTVTASDGTRTVNQAIAVTVTAVNEFSPVFSSAATANFAENGTGTVVTVQATDADLPTATLTYSISGGVDAARFAINATTGALTFVSSPNFEAPTDSGLNNVYDVQVTASDGTRSTNQAIAVTVTGVNDATPVITTAAAVNFAENGSGTVIDVNATDADLPAQTLTFSITGGADAALFAINASTGVVTFIAAPDFESPTDAGANNVYDLQVTASDGTLSVAQSIAVTVTGVNDNTPVMTSSATANFAENATGTVLTVQASDADLPAQTLSYSITGGVDAAKFAINATTGALTFVTSPNFEAPTDSGANNVYNVQVTASDGTNSVNQAVAITVTAVNDNSPLFTSSTTASFAENGTGTVIDVNATDADLPGDTLTFSISGGADAALFAIDSATGVLTFVTAPDFEAPSDAGANNVYNVQVTASDGVNSTNQGIAITVTDIGPTVISSAATANFAENGTGTVLDVDAASEGVITYSISGGADAAKFAIDAATGVLTFVAAPDFETPTDAGANNVYDVQVTASTASSGTAVQSLAVTVTAVNDNDPVITTATTASFAENATGTVIDVNATDADLPAQTLTFSITGGADAARFAINATTGVVTFVSSPNFEAPTDAGADNVYDVQVTASDGTRTVNQAIAVTVTAVNEFSPVFTSAATANFAENGTGTIISVQATDADLPTATLTYSISGGVDAAKFAIDSATGALTFVSAPNFEAPTDSGANNVYNVQVTASDGTNSTNQALAITVTAVNDNDPVITSAAAVNFAENATGTVIDVNATDADLPAQTLTFSITGGADAARFAINATTGVVTFVSSPNFESPTDVGADNVYDLTVTASDGTRTVNQAIAVTVTAVNEFSPVFSSAATANFAENGTGTIISVQATDADLPTATLTYSISGGVDAARFAINATTGALTFVSSPNFEAPTDSGLNNVYDVQVTASDGTRTVNQAIAVTVTGVNDATPVITTAAAVNFAENGSGTVIDVNATDADLPAQTLTFSITGGADAALFAINASTGVVTFIAAPDFESPTDAGANNVYDLQVTASDGTLSVAQSIAVTVTGVNDNTPVMTSSATANFAENAVGTILTVQASDADLPAQTLSYSITGGVDAAKFAINATTGALTFVTSPNFEAPTDSGANNVYNVQVTASDGTNSVNQAVAITVTAVNDNSPLFTSSTTASFAENGTGTVIDVNATDADLPGDTLTFSISGGADAALFAIDSATGVLTFVTAPDFEAPSDAGANNVYNVQVTASDGVNSTNQGITITVTDIGPTVISSAATANFAENGTGTVLDVDAASEGVITYSISGGADAAKFAIDAATGVLTFVAAPDFETPTDAGANNVYDVQVTASTASSGTAVQSLAVTVTAVNDNDPVITTATTASFAENATGTVIDVNATDADLPAQTLTFSITGGADAARFAINATTGVVTFVSSPNFEAPTDAGADNVYDVQVTASDGTRTVNQAIAVTVTAVNEFSPVFTSAATANFAENGTGTIISVQATDADLPTATLTYSISGGVDAAKFAIDSATGALTFVSAPNFEAPTDSGANNVYNVQVTASDGTNSTNQALAITVTAVNDNDPVITSAAAVNFAENATGTVIDVNATDADLPAQTLTFSITGGADAARFAINATTGVVTFVSSPNFESPTDVGADNVYDLTVTASDGTRTVNQAIAVTVTAVNEFSPVFSSAATANFAENGTGTIISVQATDADLPTATLTYSISGGVDAARFAINATTGALTFVSSPNFEAPTDSGLNNVYNVQVTASDGTNSTNQAIAVTVTGVNDATPVITTAAAVNFAENGSGTVIDVNATDADLPAQTLTFSITGGADAALFAINATTGVVTFVSSPDFESPADAGANNVYDLQVTASDGTLSVAQSIAVTVTGVNDNTPVMTSSATANFAENATGTVLTVQASDADLPAQTLSYSITGGVDAAKFAINATTGALTFVTSPNFEAPTDSGANNVYNVQVTASDGTNSVNQAVAITVTAVNDNSPLFTSSTTASFAENGTGTVIDVNATDADLPGDTLTFSISGGVDAARFAINSTTGVVTFVAAPDFEAPTDAGGNNVYDLQVTASDGTNTTLQNIAVTVTDVGPTVITSAATASFAENASGTVLDVDATSEGTVTYSISGGADAAKFAIDAATGVLTFVAAPDFETPTDAGANNVYDVQVTASTASSGTAVQSLAVTVTAVNDNDPVITTATTASFAENATGTVIDVNATDADLPAQTLTFSITGGADAAKFAINATTGVVTFVSSPNFESPTDVGADNVYDLTVTASDGTRTVNQAIAVTVTAVNEFSPVFTSAATANFAENGTGTVVTVQATDADLPTATLTYSISGGVDAAKFAIDSATGALTFVSAPNFEAPTDSGANNVYNVQVTASDGTRSTNQALAITVTAVNDNDPVITSAATVNFAENATGTVIDVNATDADLPAQTLTFSITGGADAARFAINATTGVVTFVSSPNFESPTDVGADNVYDLTVTASDGTRTVNQAIAVTVTAVNEFSPVFSSAATANFAENGTGTVVTVQATDADLPTATLTYSISGGVDAARFAINATTGALTFVSSPNFEAPTDSGLNNVYNVQVTASDGTNSTNQAIAVTVTGVNDATPVITTAAAVNFAENGSGTVIDVNATDADLPAQTLTFSITGGADAALFAINATTGVVTFVSSPDFESPTDAGANNVYDLQVTASDGTLSVAQSIAVTVTGVNDNTPVMTSSATANFAENATGTVLTVQASDADLPGQTLSYSITGGVDAAKFAINATTGALTFVTSPNFEAPTDSGANNVYNVQVTASDGANSVNQAVAITVTAVNDNSPLFTSSTTASFAENGTGTVIDVNATDADLPGDTLTFSISGGADAALFAIDSATGALTFVTAPDFEAPTDAGANNVYNVQVTASDGVNSTNQAIAITVTDIGPTVISSAATANFAENGTGTVLDVDAASEGVITYSISGGADAAKFAIDAASGVLTFVAAPDFETPTDAGANNVYDVEVTAATASSGTTSQNIAITVTAVNDNDPVITTATTVNFAENATGTVIDVNATDADLPAQTLTFSITGGADAARFAINATTGVVTFVSSPNFESPTDAGANNVYDLQVTASDGTRTVNQAIAVTVTAVNEFSPVFTSAASANFAENGTGTIVTVQATDADLPTAALTYSISGGVDAAKFAIDSATGALTFVSAPNFEAPTDSGANNVYNVQVTASDGSSSTNQALAITVTAVNDNDPVITTAAAVNFAENATGTVIDVNATDADLPAQTLTFSITGGADAAKFAINATTGVVTFVSSPNFESPTDVGADNVYDLTVTASDGTRTVNQAIAVTVTAVNEFSPVFTSAATASVAENTSGTVLTVQASDADLPGATLVYGIAVGGDGAKFSINSSTGALSFVLSPNFESPADAGANNVYDLTVTAFDGTFTSTQVLAITVTAVNEFNPVFTSASSVGFVENGTGTVVDVNATDADLPTASLTFSITGGADAAKFAINASTGVVTFVSSPDFESPTDVGGDNVYNLQVTASDGVRTSAQSIAVTVAQVNEFAPVFSSSATVSVAENVSGSILTVQATDADLPAPTLTYSISGGVDAARFSINASTGALSFVSSPDFEAPTDSGANNVYDVQVTASDGARSTNQAIAVTVTAVNDNLPLITSAATVNFAENGIGTVVDVNATDADLPAQTLTYAISGGVDQASFAIDSATGVLTFVAPPDFEAPTDSNADNVYVVDVAVSDGGNLVTQTITVTVTDASTTAISSAATANFAENGVGTVIDVDASAETPITYAISGGADAARFSIDAGTGVVSFVASPDFEVPLDADANNVYVFDVTANGGVSGSQVQTVTVTVTGIDDNAPVITSSATANFAENGTGTVIDVNATDADLPTLPLTYSISGGADAAKFAINASTGVVTFVAAPDFESPTDSNGDNVYVLQVTASDGSLSSAQTINVTVTNVNDPPVLDTSASPALASINAGSGTPSGAVGTAVSSLVDLSGGAGLNNVTDADSAAIGLALTAVNATNGTWWFSLNNGGSWSTVGAVSDTSALLLSASTGRVYFQPNAGFSGTIANAITFRAWDTSSGTAGTKVTTAGAGAGSSAFSAASDTASEVVTPVASVIDTIAISTLNGTAGLKLNGVRGSASPGFSDSAGNSVSAAGDVNGDGRADLIVGANAAELLSDSQALNRGRAYVIFGDTSANLATLANGTTGFNLNLLNGTQGAALTGASEVNGGFSYMLAGGGDHNGDGLADLLSSQQNGSGANSRGYVIYGDTATNGTGAGSFGNLNNLVASQLAGSNTSGVNDVNGDGMDDGAVFDGLDGRSLGLAIGNARDVDNDGVDDILIGNAERDTARGTDSGETFLVFGNSSSGLDGLAALGGANGTNVLSFRGQAAADNAGLEVTGIGDIDHDGFDDFLMGATKTGTDGKFYVVLGDTRANLASLSSSVNASGFNTALTGGNGFRSINTPFAAVVNADAGHHVSAVGDFNGDLIDDFVVSVDGVGMALVVFGKSTGFSATLDLTTLMTTHVGGFGIAAGVNDVAGAGDVNGDGLADLIIGNAAANQAYILFGTSNVAPMIRTVEAYGVDLVDLTDNLSLSGSGVNLQSGGYLHGKGVVLNGVASTNFGTSVSGVGDFNGDGFDDVMVGAPLASATTAIGNPSGAAFVVYGADFAQAGTTAVNSTATAASQVLRGAAGVDHLSSGGFANVGISAGNGNDVIRVHGNEFGVNGGGGVDMLTPDTNNLSLNFDALVNKNLYANIEQIQLDGFGTNSVQLDLRDVLDMNGIQSELLITGDNGVDSVLSTGQGWSLSGTTVRNVFIDSTSSSANLTFNVYSHAGMHVSLLVEQGLTQTIT